MSESHGGPQVIKFTIHQHTDFVWWATSSDLGNYNAASYSRESLLELCREGVAFVTGNPHTQFTLQFLEGGTNE